MSHESTRNTSPFHLFLTALLQDKKNVVIVCDNARITITLSPGIFRRRSCDTCTTSAHRWETSSCVHHPGSSSSVNDIRLQQENCLPPHRMCRLPSIDLTDDVPLTPVPPSPPKQQQQQQQGKHKQVKTSCHDDDDVIQTPTTLDAYFVKTNRWESLSPTNGALPARPLKGKVSPDRSDASSSGSTSSSSSSRNRRRCMAFATLPRSLSGIPYHTGHCNILDRTLNEILSLADVGTPSEEGERAAQADVQKDCGGRLKRDSIHDEQKQQQEDCCCVSPRQQDGEDDDSNSDGKGKEKVLPPRSSSNCNFSSVLSPPHKFSAGARGA
jgi:hypothetical protein